jgi:hypothetical protein
LSEYEVHHPPDQVSRDPIERKFGQRNRLIEMAILILILFAGDPVQALVLTTDDGQGNTTKPLGFDGWDYVGRVNGLTGVYLGDGWVIATSHGGPGDLLLDGVLYPWFPGSDVQLANPGGSLADLVMFQLFPFPSTLPLLPLRDVTPQAGELAILVGAGGARGTATSWDPNGPIPPPPLGGWNWDTGPLEKRWGTNQLAGTAAFLGTAAVFTEYDAAQVILPEAQAANGDSGGALFITDAMGTELAGIIYAIGPSPGQPAGTALYTNLTFAARIDVYRDEIDSLLALPEPSHGLPIGVGLLLLLAQRRRAKRIHTEFGMSNVLSPS